MSRKEFLKLAGAPLSPTIVPVRFLPENFRLFIWDGERLPTIRINQYSQAVVQEIARIPPFNALPGDVTTTVPEVRYRFSDDMIREDFRTDVKRRDSGHPNFLVADEALIFLFATYNTPDWHFGMSCLPICLKNEIEAMMNDLCEENGVTNRYSVTEFNLQELISR